MTIGRRGLGNLGWLVILACSACDGFGLAEDDAGTEESSDLDDLLAGDEDNGDQGREVGGGEVEGVDEECQVIEDAFAGEKLRGTFTDSTACVLFETDRVSVLHLDPGALNVANAVVTKRESSLTTSSNKVMLSTSAPNGAGVLVPLPAGAYVLTLSAYQGAVFDLVAQAIALRDEPSAWQHDDPGDTDATALPIKSGDTVVDYIGTDDARDIYVLDLPGLSNLTVSVGDDTGWFYWQVQDASGEPLLTRTSGTRWEGNAGPGKVFVHVYNGTGTYSLSVSFAPVP